MTPRESRVSITLKPAALSELWLDDTVYLHGLIDTARERACVRAPEERTKAPIGQPRASAA